VKRRTEAEKGEQPASDIAKLRNEDIRDSLILDCTNRKVASLYQRKRDNATTVQGLDYLNTFFKKKLVSQIDTDLLRKYISWRQKEGDSDPTIRRQLKHLEVALNLAVKENKLKSTPYFPMPKDSEPAAMSGTRLLTRRASVCVTPSAEHTKVFAFMICGSARPST
jgi:hypothetical protein